MQMAILRSDVTNHDHMSEYHQNNDNDHIYFPCHAYCDAMVLTVCFLLILCHDIYIYCTEFVGVSVWYDWFDVSLVSVQV